MDSLISTILLLLFTCTVIQVLRLLLKKGNHNLPPGPSLLTILGNLNEFWKKPQQTMAKLANVYGPIMCLKLGYSTSVIISSPDMAKEVLQTHDLLFSDRTIPQVATSLNHDLLSLPFLPVSPLWRDLRKICNNELFASKTLDASQDLRRKKLQQLLNDMNQISLSGEAVDVGIAAFKTCINFLSYTFVSEDFVQNVSKDDEYKDLVATLLKLTGTPNLVDLFPVFKIFDPQGLKRRTTSYLTKFFQILDSLINKRIKLREEKHYVTNNDMLDTLLNISEQNNKMMDKKKIRHFLLDLLVAGTDTTAYALERAMTELLYNPEIMTKAKKELEQTIGIGNPIDESDIARLPYLQAIIKETLRKYPPAPLLLPRKAKVDVQISGYTIPKGARVLINEWAIGRNPSYWENANSFSPERFIGSTIDVKGQNFHLTPFGSGRRICPGTPLAIRMLHSMLGSLINTFDWKLENDMNPKDMNLDQPLRAIPIKINH
ncbi:PREDICTED: geraniol 8-hydroxylase-like isoform X2 [Lupinus angustifolius]|nr:PREDICTED: geraniol 8-hydroxylase-like isoform X2 [Lupinus angustifolius]XP_019428973.1 PREDICTED: geraniol 8-hydroxylase-like isoform X2 [Lupinus angustifolius]